jgi:maltooligosyltrehalose synthase
MRLNAYHGYTASNLYEINPRFGGAEGLHALSDALHQRGMHLMVDVVANQSVGGAKSDESREGPQSPLELLSECSHLRSHRH